MYRERGTLGVWLGAIALAALVCLLLASRVLAAPGDVYFVDEGVDDPTNDPGAVFKVGPTGGAPQRVASLPAATADPDPNGLAMDRAGTLYVAAFDRNLYTVNRTTGAASVFTTLGPGVSLGGVAVGFDQNLYVTDSNGDALLRIDRQTKAVTPIASNFTPSGSPYGIAIARDGTIYVSDEHLTVYRVSPAGAVSVLATSPLLSGADGIALSPDQRTLFVGSYGSPDGNCCSPPNSVNKIDVATGTVSRLAEVTDSVAVTLRPDGSLLSTNTDTNILEVVPPSGSPVTPFTTPDPELGYPHDSVIEPEACGGLIPNVVGTTGPDNIAGTPYPDVISTLGGKDKVKGGGGNDVICGGPGKDKLYGQGGKDTLFGQGGKDKLVGGKKKDVDKGGGGADVCVGKGDKLKSC
jgi:Ca2+-binding RTX toxin-like protein